MSENLRNITIESFVESWDCTCNKSDCEAAVRITRIYPVDPEAPKRTVFLISLKQRKLDKIKLMPYGIIDWI